ncbi:MAG: hypothetical protein ACUVTX_07355 [Bacteroidales bacterium]
MPATSRPQDKFAFLFTGPTGDRYRNDLLNVFVTLREYYNYPASNIWVVWGGADNLTTLFPGANAVSVNAEVDPAAAFVIQYNAFAGAVQGNTPDPSVTGAKNSALIYLTGTGIAANPVDPFDYPKLVIKPGSPDVEMNTEDLKTMLQAFAFYASHVHLVMQHDFADAFKTALYDNGINSSDKTAAWVTGSQAAEGDTNGGNFTKAWISALRQTEIVSDYGSPKYADQLSVSGGSEPFLVSLEQAKQFAELKTGITYGFLMLGETAFLGKPEFLIEDGDSADGWWESPDIYLTHPNSANPSKKNDLYVTDASDATPPYNNTINVELRNTGTHPVRCYRIGLRVYRTPFGGAADYLEENGRVPAGSILKPTVRTGYKTFSNSNKDLFFWNTPFYTGITHECIWAKVQLPTTNPAAEPFDFSWNVLANNSEAQRNTDAGSDPPRKSENGVPGDSFRGSKKHIYQIENPFKQAHRFYLVTAPEFMTSMRHSFIRWQLLGKNNQETKLKFEKIDKNFTFCSFLLQPGELVSISGEFGFLPGVRTRRVKLPVEIVIDRREGPRTREPMAPSFKGKFAAIAGFTIILTNEPANLICRAVDKRGNPVRDAKINITTINGLACETIRVNEKGLVALKAINPDVYRIKAVTEAGSSTEQIVQLPGRESKELILKIERRAGKR